MATKPGKVVTYNKKLPSIKSHDLLTTWSSDLSYTICKFRTQALKFLFVFACKA